MSRFSGIIHQHIDAIFIVYYFMREAYCVTIHEDVLCSGGLHVNINLVLYTYWSKYICRSKFPIRTYFSVDFDEMIHTKG